MVNEARNEFKFNFKLTKDDRERLLALSERLQRTQADTVRWLIRRATGGPRVTSKVGFDLDEPVAIIGDWEEWGSGNGEDSI